MTTLQAIGVFAGLPAVIVLLIALPFYGGQWFRRLTRRRAGSEPDAPAPTAEQSPETPDPTDTG